MGRPKAWLELGGETLLHRVVRVVGIACPLVVVVASPGQSLPALPAGARRVDDPPELVGNGPLVGALTGLGAIADLDGAELVYIGAADAAWIDAAHVAAMLDVLAEQPATLAVVPETGPLPDGTRIVHATSGAVRMPVARDTAAALVRAGQRALLRLYDGLAAQRIDVASLVHPEAVRTCNTPDDYEAARHSIARRT